MTNNIYQAPYLRAQRNFPRENLIELSRQCDQAYIDIAFKVNNRTIGNYAEDVQSITGERWFLQGQPQQQQTLRQVYIFTTFANIEHGIDTIDNEKFYFTRMYGQFTDGTKWYGLIPGNIATLIPGQVVFDLTTTEVEFGVDGAAPAITKGVIVLEWISSIDTNAG